MGFPPSSGQAREDWFDTLRDTAGRVVFFESPHRIVRTMSEVDQSLADRPIVIGRELTKIHENLVIWDKKWLTKDMQAEKGEFVVVVGEITGAEKDALDVGEAERLLGLMAKHVTADTEAALRGVAAMIQHPVRRVRTAVKKARIRSRRATTDDSIP
jgi:16S rRNA (cytidine1402-2'-O)-methyltransferase